MRPTAAEDAQVQQDVQHLLDAVQARLEDEGWEATPRIEGSVAKDTYLHGDADADVFIAFPPHVPREELTQRTHQLAALLEDPVIAYAEHPYVQGTYRGHDAELVPCYSVDDPTQIQSAVDRTPFHTEHIKQALNEELRDEVRLLKAFLIHTGCYGAEEAIRGASGYLTELFILAHDSFEATLAWATQGFPHPITFHEDAQDAFEDPLIVLDPVDPTRNAAAAVSKNSLTRFREAAAAFRQDPAIRYFEPHPPPTLSRSQARTRTQARRTRILALKIPIPDPELEDPLYAQLRRALTLASEQLERDQVPVHATHLHLETGDPDATGWILIEASHTALTNPLLHEGPPTHVQQHADSFRDHWDDNPTAASDVFVEDDRLYVHVERDADTLETIVKPHLEQANAGKAVDDALETDTATWLEAEAALEALPGQLRAALLDRRRVWERVAEENA